MSGREGEAPAATGAAGRKRGFDMESVISYVLVVGVTASLVLLLAGTVVLSFEQRRLALDFSLPKSNLFQFISLTVAALFGGPFTARTIIDLGVIILMLTPYTRVLFSVFLFAFVERNLKYTLFTLFVLAVLTISLFVRI